MTRKATPIPSIGGGELNSSSSSERRGSACGATEASEASGEGDNHELFADFREPLRGDLTYIEAALSYYSGGPASADVRTAWDRILTNLRDVRADYLRLLHEKVDAMFGADQSSEVTTPPTESGQ